MVKSSKDVVYLTAEQEVELGRRRKKATCERESLEAVIENGGNGRGTKGRINRLKKIEEEVAEVFVERNLPLVFSRAKQYHNSHDYLDIDELVAEGEYCLLRCALKFDPDKGEGYKFSTYFCCAVRNAFSRVNGDYLKHNVLDINAIRRKKSRVEGEEESERGESLRFIESLDRTINDEGGRAVKFYEDSGEEPEQGLYAEERLEILKAAMEEYLTRRERDVLEMRWGINGYEKMGLGEVGRVFGITKERARQIQLKATKRLRKRMAESYKVEDLASDLR
jgi:RNA polymerase sigma factor (sigma-70 family)